MIEFNKIKSEVNSFEDSMVEKHIDNAHYRNEFISNATELLEKQSHPQWPIFKPLMVAGALAAIILAAVLTVIFASSKTTQTSPQTITQNTEKWIHVKENSTHLVQFSDGSTVNFFEKTSAHFALNETYTKILVLEKGNASVNVVPTTQTNWKILAGPYKVIVKGTQFDVAWNSDKETFSLQLQSGKVEIKGPMIESGQTLYAKRKIIADVPNQHIEVLPLEAPNQLDKQTASTPKKDDTLHSADTHTSTGHSQAKIKKIKKTTSSQTRHQSRQEDTPESLLNQANTARLNGEFSVAQKTYLSIRDQFPKSGHAKTAAFYIGRMAADQERNCHKAVKWFKTYLAEQKGAALKRETLGRLIDSQQNCGMLSEAKQSAKRYLLKYPSGPSKAKAQFIMNQ